MKNNIVPFRPRKSKPVTPKQKANKALRQAMAGLQGSMINRSGRGK